MKETRYEVGGMRCEGCVSRVRETLESIAGVIKVDVDLASGRVLVQGAADVDRVLESLNAIGYPANRVEV